MKGSHLFVLHYPFQCVCIMLYECSIPLKTEKTSLEMNSPQSILEPKAVRNMSCTKEAYLRFKGYKLGNVPTFVK